MAAAPPRPRVTSGRELDERPCRASPRAWDAPRQCGEPLRAARAARPQRSERNPHSLPEIPGAPSALTPLRSGAQQGERAATLPDRACARPQHVRARPPRTFILPALARRTPRRLFADHQWRVIEALTHGSGFCGSREAHRRVWTVRAPRSSNAAVRGRRTPATNRGVRRPAARTPLKAGGDVA